jgi:hypothetical protein
MPLSDPEKALFTRAREYIAIGRLPSGVPKSLNAGRGTGEPCSLCGRVIEPEQVEYEVTEWGGMMFRFHLRCHAIWQLAVADRIDVP